MIWVMWLAMLPAMPQGEKVGGGGGGGGRLAHLEEGIWFVSRLLHGLKQCKVTSLVLLNILAHMWKQDQSKKPLSLQDTMW